MNLDPGILGATSSKGNSLFRLDKPSGEADARLDLQVRLYENAEVSPHLAGGNFLIFSIKQDIYCCTL